MDTYIEQSKQELELLKSIETALNIAETENDLNDIRRELSDHGFMKNPKRASHFILLTIMDLIFMLEKTTIKTMSLPLNLLQVMTGGSTPKRFTVVT